MAAILKYNIVANGQCINKYKLSTLLNVILVSPTMSVSMNFTLLNLSNSKERQYRKITIEMAAILKFKMAAKLNLLQSK